MMTLRFLAGGSYIDIVRIHGISEPSVYRHIKRCIKVIADHKDIGEQE
jgi:DNA-binding CsgD family transcriptional regulator